MYICIYAHTQVCTYNKCKCLYVNMYPIYIYDSEKLCASFHFMKMNSLNSSLARYPDPKLLIKQWSLYAAWASLLKHLCYVYDALSLSIIYRPFGNNQLPRVISRNQSTYITPGFPIRVRKI